MSTPRVALVILDGWGLSDDGPGNAVSKAKTPVMDALLATYPHTKLQCAGRDVGLPDGVMGNSEVGHANIGAGRVLYQDLTRIDLAIETGEVNANPVLLDVAAKAKAGSGRVHLLGLLSQGGVHSQLTHAKALLAFFKAQGVPRCFVHGFLDGRDTPPQSGKGYVADLAAYMKEIGYGEFASLIGRFYAMDRDKRFERVQEAYAALVEGKGAVAADPVAVMDASYAEGVTDEFVKPTLLAPKGTPEGLIGDGDAVFFFNFRSDRAREITQALAMDRFDGFPRAVRPRLSIYACMTEYDAEFGLPVAFPPTNVTEGLGEMVSAAGLRQFRVAETEKYAHVTYFFNGGREEPFPGEDRLLVPSPREVKTYDQKPAMSAPQVTDAFVDAWGKGFDLIVCNLANGDMVGHTGNIEAAAEAVATVDGCVGRMRDAVLSTGGFLLVTADHGNAEQMLQPDGSPMTSHTLNPVPFIVVNANCPTLQLRGGGRLADIAPTVMELLGLPKPAAMTGVSLLAGGCQG